MKTLDNYGARASGRRNSCQVLRRRKQWTTYVEELQLLNQTSFKRHVCQPKVRRVELHGFYEANERAYGGCVYVRSIDNRGRIKTKLLCAKSRVAPVKVISLGRLELCGAVLLVSLFTSVRESNARRFDSTNFWTNSMIVLNWLQREPITLKTLVANRVTEIQAKPDIAAWRHPPDLISKGQTPAEFLKFTFNLVPEVPEICAHTCLVTTIRSDEILSRYSDIVKLRRIVIGPRRGRNDRILRLVQASTFKKEIRSLKNGTELHPKSNLLSLQPFLDETGILRDDGRLQNAKISFGGIGPLMVRTRYDASFDSASGASEYQLFYNCRTDYCGPFYINTFTPGRKDNFTFAISVFKLATILPRPTKRNAIRQSRLTRRNVDFRSGVNVLRKKVSEIVVGDMTTEVLIAALKRFIGRRGICRNLYSNNGTNFVGANNELSTLYQTLQKDDKLQHFLTGKEISWHFMLALSRNFVFGRQLLNRLNTTSRQSSSGGRTVYVRTIQHVRDQNRSDPKLPLAYSLIV
ncbi:uncharacterized protein LOC143433448 [Xylocopa sonorina]|uniref:uncharacterized protein LOC143433448 n=1 Tax=Xylocopa sonorina TaxID=1818115 RepID=UPI00403AF63A